MSTNLELLKGEATAEAELGVVLDGLAVDDRAEEAAGRARGDGGSLGLASQATGLLLRGLVEATLDLLEAHESTVQHTTLVEVQVREHVVMFNHLYGGNNNGACQRPVGTSTSPAVGGGSRQLARGARQQHASHMQQPAEVRAA